MSSAKREQSSSDVMKRINDYQDGSSITREACAWIVQLDGDRTPSPQDLAALREWMGRGPAHRAEITRLAELWGKLGVLTELSAAAPAASNLTRAQVNRFPRRLSWAAVATLLVGTCGLLWFNLVGPQGEQRARFATVVGEQRSIVLEDGSRVQLNTDSVAVVAFSKAKRRIRLERGEAHFEVHKDAGRPFIVQAGEGQVRAVGTAFSVRLWGSVAEVNVTEGKVELAAAGVDDSGAKGKAPGTSQPPQRRATALLEAGYTARLDRKVETILALSNEEMARRLTWRQGMLVFSGDRLDSVVREVNRYTKRPIEFSDPALGELRFGGQFKIGETQALFNALSEGFGIDAHQVGGRTVLSRADSPVKK